MSVTVVILIAIAVIAALWLFMCAPSLSRRAHDWRGTIFAHRGLYGHGCAENSLEAFTRACAAGYGSELDVQLTRDKQLVVFHDDDAGRMTGKHGLIREMYFDEVRALRLSDGTQIPTLAEVLNTVNGAQPLLIEIKTCPNINELTAATVDTLKSYPGRYMIESFNPLCLLQLRHNAPTVIRGQLVAMYSGYENQPAPLAFLLSRQLLNFLGRPDFVAYDVAAPQTAALRIQRRLLHTPLAAWTVSDAEDARRLSRDGEMPIFEKSMP